MCMKADILGFHRVVFCLCVCVYRKSLNEEDYVLVNFPRPIFERDKASTVPLSYPSSSFFWPFDSFLFTTVFNWDGNERDALQHPTHARRQAHSVSLGRICCFFSIRRQLCPFTIKTKKRKKPKPFGSKKHCISLWRTVRPATCQRQSSAPTTLGILFFFNQRDKRVPHSRIFRPLSLWRMWLIP